MYNFLFFMSEWLVFIIPSCIAIFRIVRWLIPNSDWGNFLRFAPYRKSQVGIAIITIVLFVFYIIFVAFIDVKHTIGPKVIRCILIFTWVLTLLLPDKEYENGIMTLFGFKPNN